MIYHGRKTNHIRVRKIKYCVEVTEKSRFRLHIALMRKSNRWVLMNFKGKLKNTHKMHQGHIEMDVGHLHTGLLLLSES